MSSGWLPLALVLAVGGARAEEPLPEGLHSVDGRVELEPEWREELRDLGWPPQLPRMPPPEDSVVRRHASPVVGHLELLQSFARVVPPAVGENEPDKVFVARDQIDYVLLNGRSLPPRLPLMAPDTDAVVLADGELVTGAVSLAEGTVTCGPRSFAEEEVVLIRLKEPRQHGPPRQADSRPGPTQPIINEPAGASPKGSQPGQGSGGGDGSGATARPSAVLAEAACWVGFINYTTRQLNEDYPAGWEYEWRVRQRLVLRERLQSEQRHGISRHVVLEIAAVRWRLDEERNTFVSELGGRTYGDPMPHQHELWYFVRSSPVAREFGTTFAHELEDRHREMGQILYVDRQAIADLPSRLKLEMPGMTDEMLAPIVRAIVGSVGAETTTYTLGTPGLLVGDWPGLEPRPRLATTDDYCEHDTHFASKQEPYRMLGATGVLIGFQDEGDRVRTIDSDEPVMRGSYYLPARRNPPLFNENKRVRWSLERTSDCRLPPMPDFPTNDNGPCAHYRRKLADAEFLAADARAEADWVGEQLAAADAELQQLARSLENLEPYFELALALSATSDLSQTLLKLALKRGLGGAASAGPQAASMAARIKAVMALMNLLKKGPATWAWEEGVDQAAGSVFGSRFSDTAGNPADALDALQRLSVMVAFMEGDNLEVVSDYIDNNLSMWVGSDYVVDKAKGYVEQVRAWQEKHGDLLPLVSRAYRLDYEIFRAEGDAEFWRRKLEECLEDN